MKQYQRARRVGRCAIALALALRLVSLDLFSWEQPQSDREETGQSVRFSPFFGGFSPDFVETPPLSLPEPVLPAFSAAEEPELYYAVAREPDVAALLEEALQWDLYGEGPRVLILHTHSTESYTRREEDYAETSAWRTLDPGYNMLSVGAEVAGQLEAAGIRVLRDESLHDYPSYNGSYVRSRKSLSQWLREYPTIQLVLDLHRDASAEGGRQMRTRATVAGQDSAQLMVVVGAGHGDYTRNLALGLKLTAMLERQNPGITRPLQLRSQRFNQDLSPGALIIEVGAAGNTHPEARLAARALADAIIALAAGAWGAGGDG